MCEATLGLTLEELEVGILEGPQIGKLAKDQAFIQSKTDVEKEASEALVSVVRNVLGKRKTEDYKEIGESLMERFMC